MLFLLLKFLGISFFQVDIKIVIIRDENRNQLVKYV